MLWKPHHRPSDKSGAAWSAAVWQIMLGCSTSSSKRLRSRGAPGGYVWYSISRDMRDRGSISVYIPPEHEISSFIVLDAKRREEGRRQLRHRWPANSANWRREQPGCLIPKTRRVIPSTFASRLRRDFLGRAGCSWAVGFIQPVS